jgi:AraC family ethanolamine operon transcriptional activator
MNGHSVKDVTETWGFWHWSRFSQDYRRLFGELPSVTARRTGAAEAGALLPA